MPTQGQLMRYGKKRLIDIILAREAIIKTLERQYAIARDELDRRHEESASAPEDYVTASEFAAYDRALEDRLQALERPIKPNSAFQWLKRAW